MGYLVFLAIVCIGIYFWLQHREERMETEGIFRSVDDNEPLKPNKTGDDYKEIKRRQDEINRNLAKEQYLSDLKKEKEMIEGQIKQYGLSEQFSKRILEINKEIIKYER